MILAILLAAAQPAPAAEVRSKARAMHASLFVFPILRDLVDAIREQDQSKFSRHVRPGAYLADTAGNIFPLTTSSLQSLSETCTFKAMSYNYDPLYDDGATYWDCPTGLSQLHFKIRNGVVESASPFRSPAFKGSKGPLPKKTQ